MKLTKILSAAAVLALLAGCASQQTDETTAEGQQAGGSCCKAEAAKAGCCDASKTEATKADEKPVQKN